MRPGFVGVGDGLKRQCRCRDEQIICTGRDLFAMAFARRDVALRVVTAQIRPARRLRNPGPSTLPNIPRMPSSMIRLRSVLNQGHPNHFGLALRRPGLLAPASAPPHPDSRCPRPRDQEDASARRFAESRKLSLAESGGSGNVWSLAFRRLARFARLARVSGFAEKRRGLPQSKTLARLAGALGSPPGFPLFSPHTHTQPPSWSHRHSEHPRAQPRLKPASVPERGSSDVGLGEKRRRRTSMAE